jgi:UrcA family protein
VNYAAAEDLGRGSRLSAAEVIGSAEDGTLVKIRYHDLDLRSEVGIRTLYHRIKVAAQKVCYESNPVWVLQRHNRLQQCVESAVDAAVVQVGNAQLAAVHHDDTRSKSGG